MAQLAANRMLDTRKITHDEWLEARRLGLGGSDIAGISGFSKYSSPMSVYLDKLGLRPPIDDNAHMKAGRILEPVIAGWFTDETGIKVIRQNAVFQNKERPWMLANIDRWVLGKNEGLECKNGGEYVKDQWADNKVPMDYILQGNWYMAVLGAERWWFAVLLGGWDFQWRVIERDEKIIEGITKIAEEFWFNHVLAKVPPAYSYQDTDILKERYPEHVPGRRVELPTDIVKEHLRAKADEKEAKQRKDTYGNQLRGIMKDAELGYLNDELMFTFRTNKKGARSLRHVGAGSDDE